MTKHVFSFLLLAASCMAAYPLYSQNSINLFANQDNSLYESTTGALSNGSGSYIFAGRTNQGSDFLRRGLIMFPVPDSIPAGSQIDSVSLILNMSLGGGNGTEPVSLHRVTHPWGEGASNAPNNEGAGANSASDDATWIHAFYDTTLWANAGGDFIASASATTSINTTVENKTWTGAGLVADVAYWVANPDSNFGWILIGNENVAQSARRFGSRENEDETQHPRLFIRYTLPSSIDRFEDQVKLQISPNPATGYFSIDWQGKTSSPASIQLMDIQGKEVYHHPSALSLLSGSVRIPVDHLPSGVYMVKFSSEGQSLYRKLVVRAQ